MNDSNKLRQRLSHPLDSRIMRCTDCGFHETGLSARLRYFDHPDARKGFEVKHCPRCGGNTLRLRDITEALEGKP
jgi:predicted RNA-binding Zn-ribbon protein involved in translation (DUF1610 family)